MYQPHPASPYMLPGGYPPGPSGTPHLTPHQLPSLSAGFDRLPVTTSSSAVATSPVNSPHSPATHQRLPPTTNNGLPNSIVEPKLEKVRKIVLRRGCNFFWFWTSYWVTLSKMVAIEVYEFQEKERSTFLVKAQTVSFSMKMQNRFTSFPFLSLFHISK